MLGILDLRSIRYYKIKHGVLQQNLGKYFRFESANILCEQFNKFVNTLKKKRKKNKEIKDKYPWLDKDDERRNMSEKDILEKYIDLEKSCLSESERKEVIDILYKYKDTVNLRGVIGKCPHIELEIDVTDKSPYFIRQYHVKEEDKTILDKEMKRLCYLGILKEGF